MYLSTLSIRSALSDVVLPKRKSSLIRKPAKEIDVVSANKEVGVVDCDRYVRAWAQSQRFYLDVSVKQLGRKIVTVLRNNSKCRGLLTKCGESSERNN